jgi:hypothetical protein
MNAIGSSSQGLPSLSPSSSLDVANVDCFDLDLPFPNLELKALLKP